VGPPFEAKLGEPFHVLWEPAAVAIDGWEDDREGRLSEVRIVACRFVEVLGARERGIGRSPCQGLDLRVEVLASIDPMRVEPRAGTEVDFAAWPFAHFSSRQRATVDVRRAPDRVLVSGSVEGDVCFALLVDPDARRVTMVVDTSLCQDFFWFGNADASADLRAELRRVLARDVR
jgi:hypothetical protein